MKRYRLIAYYTVGTECFGDFDTKEEAIKKATSLLEKVDEIIKIEIKIIFCRK